LPRSAASVRPLLVGLCVFCAAYVAFMGTVDIPMYVSRWLTDQANGREYLSLSEGLWDACSRWTVLQTWNAWHPEMPWMSLYFSVGAWCSLAAVHLRLHEPRSPDAGELGAVTVTD
jgi:hypothetical protein